MEHRIFPDCLHNFAKKQITICCRHSRYTPRYGSWNPEGGYPTLADSPEVKLEETWREEGWVPNQRERQLMKLLEYPLTEDQIPMVTSLLNPLLTDEEAQLVVALVLQQVQEEQAPTASQ
eukprot:3499328-Amphidinium_carterae.2